MRPSDTYMYVRLSLNSQDCQTFVVKNTRHKTLSLLLLPAVFFINQCDYTLSAKLIHEIAALV